MLFNIPDPSQVYFGANVPEQNQDIFEEIISRAVSLINIEPEETIILSEKQSELEEMIISVWPEYYDDDYEAPEGEELEFYPSHAKILHQNINIIELESNDKFSWPQYFGLLAISEINQLLFLHFFEDKIPPDMKEYLKNSDIRCLKGSLEAVSFGEALGANIIATQAVISKQAQKAISARYKPLNKIKGEFFEYYLNSSDKSNKSEIARKFYRNLSDEQKKDLTSTLKIENACRTLITHLNKMLR